MDRQIPDKRPLLSFAILFGLGLAGTSSTCVAQEFVTSFDPHAPRIYVGSASCASSSCHGGTSQISGPGFAAHRLWLSSDPHARAHEVLYESRSQQIVERLGPEWKAAHREERCLACHSVVASPHEQFSPTFQLSDGVSCEACHGPAQAWLLDHSRRDIWAALTPTEKQARGFRPLSDLTVRAEHCASCHVGDEHRDVNHDLIAAGHPRLAFEFAGYSAIYKKHWRLEKDLHAVAGSGSTTLADLDAQMWIVGQMVSRQKAVELTQARARRAVTQLQATPWPEFTEYSCFACHHDLQDPNWRRQGALTLANLSPVPRSDWWKRPPGSIPWQSWLIPFGPELAAGNEDHSRRLNDLQKQLQRVSADPRETSRLLEGISSSATVSSVSHPIILDATTRRQWIDRVTGVNSGVWQTWEGAAQTYLALVSLTAEGNQPHPHFDDLRTIRTALTFNRSIDSPAAYDEQRWKVLTAALNRIRERAELPAVVWEMSSETRSR